MTAASPVSIGMKSVSKEHASRVLLIGREPQLSRALEVGLDRTELYIPLCGG